MPGETQNLSWRAQLALRGISRREAAGALYLSLSALDRRLSGRVRLSPSEEKALSDLIGKGRKA